METSTRSRILTAATELFQWRGYAGTGLKAVSARADAPFGSLYHHFPKGKQQLAAEAIRVSGAQFQSIVMDYYDAESTPAESLRAVFTACAVRLQSTDFADACPIATVSLEVASTDEVLRLANADVFEEWIDAFTTRLGSREKALVVLALIEGAFVFCRTLRSVEPMTVAADTAVAELER